MNSAPSRQLHETAAGRASTAQDKPCAGWLATGSVVGAVLASSCCILPLVLFSLGIGGAWIGNLTALEPYKPIFIALTLLLLVGGFVSVYRKPHATCSVDGYCASPLAGRVIKIALWSATLLVTLTLAWPYLVPYLLGE
jgi:mercuric ion transport protein